MSSRIKIGDEEAQWLYSVIQKHIMDAVLSGVSSEQFQQYANLIQRIKHAAAC